MPHGNTLRGQAAGPSIWGSQVKGRRIPELPRALRQGRDRGGEDVY